MPLNSRVGGSFSDGTGSRLVLRCCGRRMWFDWAATASKLSALQQSLDARHAARRQLLESEAAEEEKRLQLELRRVKNEHARRMEDAAVVDGSMARAAHETEWRRRLALDLPMERSLLEMQ